MINVGDNIPHATIRYCGVFLPEGRFGCIPISSKTSNGFPEKNAETDAETKNAKALTPMHTNASC